MIKNVKNLEDDVGIFLPGSELRIEDLVAMQFDDSIAHLLVICFLDALQKLDGDPFLLALHEGSHDFGDTIAVERLGFDTIDIVLIVFGGLLLSRFLGDCCVPAITIVNAKSLNGGGGQLRGTFSLGFATDESSAISFTTIARLRIGTITIDIVIEDEFFAGLNVSLSKYAHAELVTHHPLVDLTIGIARVVAETSKIAFSGRINEFTFAEGHEIEMDNALFVILDHAATELGLIDDFADVFKDEVSRAKITVCSETIAFLFGFDDGDIGILSLLEALVLAVRAAAAISDTLHFSGSIDAIGVFATCNIFSASRICD